MASVAAVAVYAKNIRGNEHALSGVSNAGQWKAEMNSADGIVYATVDGGAWFPLLSSGGIVVTVDLQTAYQGGNQINLTQALGAVILSSARTSGNILQIATTNFLSGGAATITAISIDMSSLGTAATPATGNLPAISIVGAHSSVAKAAGAGLVNILSAYRNATMLSLRCRNKQAAAGSIVVLGWDTTNYEGAPASSILTDTTHMVTLDGQTNVDASGNPEFVGLRILAPSTTSATASTVVFSSLQTAGNVAIFGPNSAVTTTGQQRMVAIGPTFGGGSMTVGSSLIGLAVDLSTSVTLANNSVTAIDVKLGVGGNGANAASGLSWARSGTLTTSGNYTGSGIILTNTPARAAGAATENGTLLNISHAPGTGGGGALTDTTTGISLTMTPFSSSAVSGIVVTMGANTSSTGAGVWTKWNSLAGATNGIVRVSANVNGTTTAAMTMLKLDSATATYTLGAALTGVNVDLSTQVSAGAFAVTGLSITIPATTRANAAGEGAIVVTSNATRQRVVDLLVRNTGGTLFSLAYAGATALTAGVGLYGFNIDLNTNVTGNTGEVQGIAIYLPASSASTTAMFKGQTKQTAGSFFTTSFLAASTLTGSLTGFSLDLSTNVTPGAFAVTGLSITIPASTSNSSRGITISSTQRGSSYGIEVLMNPGSSAGVYGIYVSMGSNATGMGVRIESAGTGNTFSAVKTHPSTGAAAELVYAPTSLSSGGASVLYMSNDTTINSSSTLSTDFMRLNANIKVGSGATLTLSYKLIDIQHHPSITSGSITDTTTGLYVDMAPASSSAVNGIIVVCSSNVSSSGACIKLTMSGAGAGVYFASADSGVGHVLGPVNASLVLKAGSPTSSGNGNGITMTASAANTSGNGGGLTITSGAGANAGNGGDISLVTGAGAGAGTHGRVNFDQDNVALGGGAAPTLGTIGGSGPATAGQNMWLAVKIAGTLSFLPVWR